MIKFLKNIKRRLNHFIHNILPKYFVVSPFFSSLYYLLFSSKFRREQHATLKGRLKYMGEVKADNSNRFTLVRNTHRIEKGLLMRPRKPIFALDYIEETMVAFEKIWDGTLVNQNRQQKWFYDVLNEYFTATEGQDALEEYRMRFKHAVDPMAEYIGPKNIKSIPYLRKINAVPDVSYDQFFKLTRQRRSVRWFLDKEVPRDLLDKAILAANQSPSACNRQPFYYRIIDDPKMRVEVSKLPRGIRGYAENIPVLIVVVGDLSAYFDERDRHIIYIDSSLASMSLMLALETLGLSSCAINWPDIEELEKVMEETLNLKVSERPIMCLAVGYPDPEGQVAYSEKKSIEEIRIYN